MKRTIATLLILAVAGLSAFALDEPHRIVEFGTDFSGGFSNNYFTLGSFFNEDQTLVLDFNDIAESVATDGFCLGGEVGTKILFGVNIPKLFGVQLYVSLDGSTISSIPASLFDLIANGNSLTEANSGAFTLGGSLYLTIGAEAVARVGPIDLTVRPEYFMPIIYVDKPTASYSFGADENGVFSAKGSVDASLYSIVPFNDLTGGVDVNTMLNNLLASGGVDVFIGAEYQLMPMLDLGASLEGIPLVPARLSSRAHVTASFDWVMEGLLNSLLAGNFAAPTLDGPVVTNDTNAISVYRPFKLGAYASWRPLFSSKLLTLEPSLALAVTPTPTMYVDCGLTGRLKLAEVLLVEVGSHCEDLVWRESLTVGLNLRVSEIILEVSSCSPSFVRSFMGSGFGFSIGTRFGF